MTPYARQQNRHRCKEQTFGLHGRRQGWKWENSTEIALSRGGVPGAPPLAGAGPSLLAQLWSREASPWRHAGWGPGKPLCAVSTALHPQQRPPRRAPAPAAWLKPWRPSVRLGRSHSQAEVGATPTALTPPWGRRRGPREANALQEGRRRPGPRVQEQRPREQGSFQCYSLISTLVQAPSPSQKKKKKPVYYHRESRWPVQVWYMKRGTQSWWSGTNQRDRVGREVGGGHSGWGDTCIPIADSYRCMAKTTIILWSNWPPIKIN